jgi:hypothetical protein
VLVAAPSAPARDFLTTDEADQIRLTQETNARLVKYAEFARQRVELASQLAQEGKAGRTTRIHEALDDYIRIIEAMDTVADDALLRRVDIAKGISSVIESQEEFLAALEALQESEPEDMARYRFVLETAIDTTADSLEINQEDLADRRSDVVADDEQDRRNMEALMTPESVKERSAANAAEDEAEAEEKRRIPTLLREGETLPSERQP